MIRSLTLNIRFGSIVALIVILTIGFNACKNNDNYSNPENPSEKSNEQLMAENAELEALSLEKDRLMSELVETTSYINQIYAALDEVRTMPDGDQRSQILAKISILSDSLSSSQDKIKRSSATIKGLQKDATELAGKIAALELTITSMQEQMTSKESEIATLKEESGILKKDVDSYKSKAESEASERSRIETEKNTYYYIVGKAEQLEERGIITEEGSGFLGIGGTYVPARNLNEQDFKRVDVRNTRTLEIPEKHQIISSHNPRLLERVANGMYITDPARFWTSKFLIIIDKR